MNEKIISVYFDRNGLPYKDRELTTHFPIIGSGFLGASNTTKIRFYFENIGLLNDTYLAVSKLPNGKQGSQLLNIKSSDENGQYAELSLSEWYFQAKGDVFVGLKVYRGGVDVTIDDETGFSIVSGDPVIMVTGSIKLAINYAPIGDVPDYRDEFTAYNDILALMREKPDIDTVPLLVNFTDYATWGALYDYVDNRPFIAYVNNVLSLCAIETETEDNVTTYKLLVNNSTGIFRTNTFALDSAIGDEYGAIAFDQYELKNDNVIDLTGTSGTLTSEQQELIVKPNAYIRKDYNSIYHKASFDTFFHIALVEYTDYVTLYTETIVLDTSSSPYTWTQTLKTTNIYKKEKIDSIVSGLETDINASGHKLVASINNTTYVMTIELLDNENNTISTQQVDLPLESIVTSATYYDEYSYGGVDYEKVIVIVLATTPVPTIVPVGDLVSGLVNETQLEVALSGYVPKTSDPSELYCNDAQGNPTSIPFKIGIENSAYTIPQRDANQDIQVPYTPSSNTSASSKGYVDYVAYGKQDRLVSGTNIKTINNQSILGSGNINISGSGATWGSITGDIDDQTDLSNELTNIREVAEGKCKTYIISYNALNPRDSENFVPNRYKTVDGTYFQSVEDLDDYLYESGSEDFGNGAFDYNDDNAPIDLVDSFIVTTDYVVIPVNDHNILKKGDIILVVETNVPDRWFEGIEDFYPLETAKVDLDNYYTKTESDENVVKNQANMAIVKDALTNVNGRVFQNYTATLITSGYTYYLIQKNSANLTKADAIEYMNYMTGSKFVPEYNYDFPRNTYFIFEDNTIWKPQFDTTNGLLLYKVSDGYALKEQGFNVINASDMTDSTHFTADQVSIITNGKPTRISGNVFNKQNVILYPPSLYGGTYRGYLVGTSSGGTEFETGAYYINSDNSAGLISETQSYLILRSVSKINGKSINYYRNNVYPYATNSTTELKYETFNEISLSADITFTLKTAPTNTFAEYNAHITNSGASTINLTFTGVSSILCNDGTISINSNVLSLPSGFTIEVSIVNGKMVAVNFEA